MSVWGIHVITTTKGFLLFFCMEMAVLMLAIVSLMRLSEQYRGVFLEVWDHA